VGQPGVVEFVGFVHPGSFPVVATSQALPSSGCAILIRSGRSASTHPSPDAWRTGGAQLESIPVALIHRPLIPAEAGI